MITHHSFKSKQNAVSHGTPMGMFQEDWHVLSLSVSFILCQAVFCT